MKKVRDGYKMTELGEIPSEWEVKNIGEVAKFQGGYAFKSSDYVEDGIRLVKITNVQQKNISWNEEDLLPVKYLEKFNEYKLQEDDVVIAMTRPIISTGIKVCKIEKRDLPCLLNQRVGRFIIKDSLISKYLYNYCFTDYFINKVKELCSTTGQPNISANQIESILITIPSVKEQEKIASILSTVDEQIDNVDALIEKNKELKKGLMQTLLTKGIGHTKFKKTEIGEIPEEWEVKRVGDITEIKTGGTPSTKCEEYWKDGRIPWMVSGDVNKGIINSVDGRITESGMNNSAAKLLPKDTVMIALNGQGKTKGTVAYLNIEVTCNQSLAGFLPKEEKFYSKYLFYNLQNRYSEIRGLTGDGARNGLNLGILRDILIPLPSIEEQRRTASILSQIDEKIEEYENKKQKLEEIKKGLMQQLLTGKLRVK